MLGRDKEVIILSKEIDGVLDKLINKYRLPSDIAIEVLAFSFFKSLYSLKKSKVHSKETLEMFTRGILNKHFISAGLDLFVSNLEWPIPTSSSDIN